MRFNGTDGYADTDLSPVNTTQGFAVSAWVNFDQQPTHSMVVATQPGNVMAGFELYYSPVHGWVFNQHASDTAGAASVMAKAATPAPVTVGKWTHVAGSYDATVDRLRLYVDGQLVGEKSWSTSWNARRGLRIGAGSYTGTPGNFFSGAIDDVQIFNRQLEDSEVTQLRAKQTVGDPGQPALAVFPMDEAVGATEIVGHGGVIPATYHGTVSTGVPGVAGKAAHFDGATGYAKVGETSAPHVNTFRSFTVSAWAKLDSLAAESGVVVLQGGKERPGMELYYSAAAQQWAFAQYTADSADAGITRVTQPVGAQAYAGEWAHLVGVHDTDDNTLTLYVNGTKAGSVTQNSPFYADRSMYIGVGDFGGARQYFFPGTVDDVRVQDRPVSAEEVQQMFKQRPLLTSRWTFETASGTPLTTPDASASGNDMTLNGGATLGSGWVDGGVDLDGVDDYGVTSVVPVDTSASFTVSAWAQAAALPNRSAALLSVPGTAQSAFTVRYEPRALDAGPGHWRIVMASADSADVTVDHIDNGQFFSPTEWTHLALVYDGFAKHLSLYVNGQLEEVACTDDDGDGESDDTACEDRLSWADDVLSFKSAQPMQLGRAQSGSNTWGDYWPGAVSDVWAFQGALTETQVQHLAEGLPGAPTEVPDGDF